MIPTTTLFLFIATCLAQAATSNSPNPTGPRLSDGQFFSQLDFARPELAAVQAAVAKSHWPAAQHALAEYLRTRKTPRWGLDPHAIGQNPGYRNADADRALNHRFSSIGIPWQFGATIDWSFNPTTQPDASWPRNHEWTWQLSRHVVWVDLGQAFHATGDEHYAREFVSELTSWIRDCPRPLDKPANVAGSRWRTIDRKSTRLNSSH